MTDYQSFKQGAVQYPLPPPGSGIGGIGASLLRDADPELFYLLEFYASVLNTHLAQRFLADVSSGGVDDVISSIVAETLPLNPEQYLTERHTNFPLLTAYRKTTKVQYIGSVKLNVDDFDVAYVLPPLQAGEAERLLPILSAVYDVIDNRTEQGMDPSYTPTSPMGTAGESVWTRAGVAVAEVKGATYGGYQPADKFFPCVIIHLELKSKSDFAITEFETSNGQDVHIDLNPVPDAKVVDFIQFATWPAPTVTSIAATSGTKAGGTTVTITGTNFRVGTTPTVLFGGLPATSVTVLSATSIQCKTPAHNAYDTFAADITVTNADGQSGTLEAAYTFTTP